MFKEKINTIRQIHNFIIQKKIWYLYPIIFAFLLVFVIIVLAETTAIGPVIYTIF